jgi:intron-binding protein aquarius
VHAQQIQPILSVYLQASPAAAAPADEKEEEADAPAEASAPQATPAAEADGGEEPAARPSSGKARRKSKAAKPSPPPEEAEEEAAAPVAAAEPMQVEEPAAPAAAAAAAPAEAARVPPPARPAAASAKPPRPSGALTMEDISRDGLTRLAQATWSPAALASGAAPAFDAALVEKVYQQELGGGEAPAPRRVALLELSQYLENYLWPGLQPEGASAAALLSVAMMVNEKFREGVPAWGCFQGRQVRLAVLLLLATRVLGARGRGHAKSILLGALLRCCSRLHNLTPAPAPRIIPRPLLLQEAFAAFFARLVTLPDAAPLSPHQRLARLVFFINAFQSLETPLVAAQVLRLVSLPLWHALSPGRLQLELHAQPALAKLWKQRAKRQAKAAAAAAAAPGAPPHVPAAARPENRFLPAMLADFLERVAGVAPASDAVEADRAEVHYCERFVELLTDLLSQLPTRRFTSALLEDRAVLVKCRMSRLFTHPSGRLFAQLVDLLSFYAAFPIDAHTGDALGEEAVTAAHYERVAQLQRLAFRHVPKLRELALESCGAAAARGALAQGLAALTPEELRHLVTRQLRLVDGDDPCASDPAFLTEVMLAAYERRRPQSEVINDMPLYPTEALLLDERAVPSAQFSGDGVLALPKLNLQFLTLPDYLLRNFHLFRLEAAYEVREDVADALRRVAPRRADDDSVRFGGWARMASTLESFAVVEVRKPRVGENRPAGVTADLVVDTRHMRPDVRGEWDELKEHDVLFLLAVAPTEDAGAAEARMQRERGA